jgi:hypothetical protein
MVGTQKKVEQKEVWPWKWTMLLLLMDVCKNLKGRLIIQLQWKLQIYRDDGTMEWSAEHWFILAQKRWLMTRSFGPWIETCWNSSSLFFFFPALLWMGSYHSQTKWVERLKVGQEFGTLLTFQHFANCQLSLNFCSCLIWSQISPSTVLLSVEFGFGVANQYICLTQGHLE